MLSWLQYCNTVYQHWEFPRKLVFATMDFMGLGLLHLFTIQEAARWKDIIIHVYNNMLTGHLYKTSLELLLIELGMGSNWSGLDHCIINLLTTPSLIQASVLFMNRHNIQLNHDIKLQPRQEHDQLIMPSLVDLQLSTDDLKACNHC
jgi:hypothetical protein